MVVNRLELDTIKPEPQSPEVDTIKQEPQCPEVSAIEEEPESSEALEEDPESSDSGDSSDVSLDWAEINRLIGEPDSSFALPSSSDSDWNYTSKKLNYKLNFCVRACFSTKTRSTIQPHSWCSGLSRWLLTLRSLVWVPDVEFCFVRAKDAKSLWEKLDVFASWRRTLSKFAWNVLDLSETTLRCFTIVVLL